MYPVELRRYFFSLIVCTMDGAEGNGTYQGTCEDDAHVCHRDGSCNVCQNSIVYFKTGSFHSGCEAAKPICDKSSIPYECKECVVDSLPNVQSCGSTAKGAAALGIVGGGVDKSPTDFDFGSCSVDTNKGCECDVASNTGCPAGTKCIEAATSDELNTCNGKRNFCRSSKII